MSTESELATQHNNHEIYTLSNESELATKYNNPEIYTLSNKSKLATQYNNPEIYILSNESELATQHNNHEIYTLSNESELATQYNNHEIYTLSNELEPAIQYDDTLPVLNHSQTSNAITLWSYWYIPSSEVYLITTSYAVDVTAPEEERFRYRSVTVKLRFHIKCNKILFWTVFTPLHARHEGKA